MNLSPGSIIGSYQVDCEIGRGGRAVVYRAWQHTVGRWVVLKVLSQRDPGALANFRREVQFTANLGHAGVRQVYDAGQTPDGYAYLAMQYVETSLRQVMQVSQEQGRAFTCAQVARLLQPVAEVLDHLHRKGMVHLDVKPENILVDHDGKAVLADFGSAHSIGTLTHEGTPRYFSPEQAAGDVPVSGQSDIYSLACVAYELLTGRTPFAGDTDIVLVRQHLEERAPPLGRFRTRAPRGLSELIGRALAKDPRERPASALAFTREVGRYVCPAGQRAAPRPEQSTHTSTGGPASRRPSSGIRPWGLWVLAAVLLLVVLLGVVAVALALAHAPLVPLAAASALP